MTRLFIIQAATSAVLLAVLGSTQAANDTWVGNTSANWNDANWTGGNNPPLGGDALFFGAAGSSGTTLINNFPSGISFSGITFNSGAPSYTFSPNWTRLTGDIVNNSTSLQVLNLGHELSSSVQFNAASAPLQFGVNNSINLNGNTLTVTGPFDTAIRLTVSGAGANSQLVKTGGGTLTLSGSNIYNGQTTVSAGVLEFAGGGSAYSGGTYAGNLVVESAGTLRFARHDTFGNAAANPAVTITVNGGTVTNSAGWFTPLGPVVLNQGTIAAAAGHATWDAFLFRGTVTTVAAANPSYLTSGGGNSGFHLNSSGTTFNVADGAAASDLIVSGVLEDYYPGTAGSLVKSGAGTMVLSGANTYTGNTTVIAGQIRVTGSITGGAAGSRFIIGSGAGSNGSMLFDMGAGTSTFYADGYATSGDIGENGGTGALVLQSGTLNIDTRTAGSRGSLRLGVNGAATGTLTVDGGILNVPGRILMAANSAASVSTLTVNNGQVNLGTAGSGAYGDPGWGLLWTGSGTSTVNLNGGTLALYGFHSVAAGTVNVNLDGGTLKAQNHNATFVTVPGTFNMVVKSGGAVIETAGYNITLATPLTHDALLGSTPDGGLTKNGGGTLTLTGASTYTGATTVNAGTLQFAGGGTVYNGGAIAGTITVNNGGMLLFSRHDTFGNHMANPNATVTVQQGGLVTNGATYTTLRNLALSGGELQAAGGANASFPAFQLKGTVTVNGNATSLLSVSASPLNAFTQIQLGNNAANGVTIFDVADGSAPVDLAVSATLVDGRNSGYAAVPSGLTKTGLGTMLLSGANTYTGNTAVSAGTLLVSGSIAGNPSNTTTSRLIVGGGAGSSGTATFDMGAGTSTFGGDGYSYSLDVGENGGTGVLTLKSGTISIGSASNTTASMRVGCNNSANGTVTIDGATLNVPGRILMAANAGANVAAINLNGGTLNLGSQGNYAYFDPGRGLLWFGAGDSTVNLNGGTLALYSFYGGGANAKVNLNGGILKAVASNGTFDSGTFTMTVKSGGVVIDSAGFAVTVGKALQHDATLGSTPDGGLTKNGGGTLTLTGASTYTGATTVNAGTLQFAGGGTVYNGGAIAGTITVNNGGTLLFSRHDTFGNHMANPNATVTVQQGGLVTNGATYTTLRNLTLSGGELQAAGGANASFPAFQLKGTVTVNGNATSLISVSASPLNAFTQIQLGNNAANGLTIFDVADGSAPVDLAVSATLVDGRNSGYAAVPSGLTKTGLGTMLLSGASSYAGVSTVSQGTLLVDGSITGAGGDVTVADGATLGGNGAIVRNVIAQAGAILAPGANPGTAGVLGISGNLTLAQSSVLDFDLGAANTAAGDRIDVTGNLTLDGILNVTDLAGFGTPGTGDRWRLVNYTGSLSDNGLNLGSVPALGPALFFTIDTSTAGQVDLLVGVPEPSSLLLAGLAAIWLAWFGWRRRRG